MRILLCLGLVSLPSGAAEQQSLRIEDFSEALEGRWTEKSVRGRTEYRRVLQEEGHWALHAVARDSASTLGMRLEVDPRQYPVLRWRWKVEKLPERADEGSRKGDDAAARILLIFNRSIFPWRIKSLCYLWANTLKRGASAPNVFSSNAKLIAVESGTGEAGRWKLEERNWAEDYEALFGEKPKKLIGIAILTDADNTGSEAIAYYDFIELRSQD